MANVKKILAGIMAAISPGRDAYSSIKRLRSVHFCHFER